MDMHQLLASQPMLAQSFKAIFEERQHIAHTARGPGDEDTDTSDEDSNNE